MWAQREGDHDALGAGRPAPPAAAGSTSAADESVEFVAETVDATSLAVDSCIAAHASKTRGRRETGRAVDDEYICAFRCCLLVGHSKKKGLMGGYARATAPRVTRMHAARPLPL